MSVNDPILPRAISFAARAHQGHFRKDGATPYVAHPLRVMTLVRQFGCDDPEVLAAAVLHDTIEDTRTDFEDLAEEFSPRVAQLVAMLSKDARLPEAQREREYFDRLGSGPPEALLCKLCDMLDNLRESQGHSIHARRRYLTRADEVLKALTPEFSVTWPSAREALQGAVDEVRAALTRESG